ncbi:MAG: hypothetical protein JWP89_5035 [Schlesneria sp.]|nr:hypothetical protein [Schlesneria sp.]
MFEFFYGWRRKMGTATLLIALLFMGGWIRSFVVDDYIAFPFLFCVEAGSWSLDGLASKNESLVLYAYVLPPIYELGPDSEEIPLASSGSTIPAAEPALKEHEPADALSACSESEAAADEWTIVGESAVSCQAIIIGCCIFPPEPVVTLPFCWIVMPLTLLSAYLLLWNPRKPVSTPL